MEFLYTKENKLAVVTDFAFTNETKKYVRIFVTIPAEAIDTPDNMEMRHFALGKNINVKKEMLRISSKTQNGIELKYVLTKEDEDGFWTLFEVIDNDGIIKMFGYINDEGMDERAAKARDDRTQIPYPRDN